MRDFITEQSGFFVRVLDLDKPRTQRVKYDYSVRWGGNKWPRRPLGDKLQCGGLWPLCEGLLGGSSVEEGVGQPAGVPQVVMEWMATITGDHVGIPEDLGNFSRRKKNFWGAKIRTSFSVEFSWQSPEQSVIVLIKPFNSLDWLC